MKLSEKIAAAKAAKLQIAKGQEDAPINTASQNPPQDKAEPQANASNNAQETRIQDAASSSEKEDAASSTSFSSASSGNVQADMAGSRSIRFQDEVVSHDSNRIQGDAPIIDSRVQPANTGVEQVRAEDSSIGVLASVVSQAIKKESLSERIARKKKEAQDLLMAMAPPEVLGEEHTESPEAVAETYTGAFALNINLNKDQLAAKEMALSGRSFCLIGAAGTGKTTTQREVAASLLRDSRLKTTSFKIAGGGGNRIDAPSIAFCAYTRRASANLQRAVHKDPTLAETLKHNIMTIHALLEYEPETFWDDEKEKESMRFIPKRNRHNPLTITHLVIEEASMVGLDLWEALYDALPVGVQIIFIGDINQLPPVFGASILNYALVQLPIIELTHVYRQQGDSLVLANAHNILAGKMLEEDAKRGFNIIRGKSNIQVGQEKMSHTLGLMFKTLYERSEYDPEQDIILSPFNKQPLGTDNMNKWIAQFLGDKREALVHEIIAGFNTLYLAVGDKVMYNKQDSIVMEIKANMSYHGKSPQLPGKDLSRFGHRVLAKGAAGDDVDLDDLVLNYSDFSVDELAEESSERKMQASHTVTILTENGTTEVLSAAGDFGPQVFSLGYVLTVHKAQGCEWRKVFIILHKDHSIMANRELFYTAVTRAREECNVIAKDHMIEKAIRTQKIKGDSLADKIEYFNSGAVNADNVFCTKG